MLYEPISKIARALQISTPGRKRVMGFAIDSRKVAVQGLFFAISGQRLDGHQFLHEVAKRGGCAAVVHQSYKGPDYGLILLRVENVETALHNLAKASFSRRSGQVIAITGSMGKTTTKEFTATLLSSKYKIFKTEGNQNTQLSVPLAILNLDGDYEVLVLEMGMSEHGQIQRLVKIVPPDIALVTRIAPAGLRGLLGGLEAVALAKSEIFSHPRTRLGIISAQAASFDSVLHGGDLPKRIYGPGGEDQLTITEGVVQIGDSPSFKLSFDASHLLENFLGAVSVCRAMGLSWDEIGARISLLKPFERRFEIVKREGVTFIQDSYNANPDSVLAALENLPKGSGRRIGVLGAMPDLGQWATYYHTEIGKVAATQLDELICIGEGAEHIVSSFLSAGKPATFMKDLCEIKEMLSGLAQPGDLVLIKGGNSLKLWTLLEV